MNKATTLLLTILIFTAGAARATEPARTPQYKSPETAAGISLLGTAVPVGLMVMASSNSNGDSDAAGLVMLGLVGSIFGPGLGHSYAGDSGRFWRGAGWRTVGWTSLFVAVAISWDNTDSSGAGFLAVGGAAIVVVSTIRDIAMASDSANRYNQRFEPRKVTMMPMWSPRDNSVGLGVSLGF